MSEKSDPKWKRFEALVAKLQQEFSPNAKVTLNDKIKGRRTGIERQIDISVRQTIGQFDMLIVIDCKDYSSAVDVKGVEEFLGLVDDVGANKSALVASGGFTQTAKTRAKDAGVDIYSLVDAEDHDWRSFVAIPFVCDFRGFGKIRFKKPASWVRASFFLETVCHPFCLSIPGSGCAEKACHCSLHCCGSGTPPCAQSP